MSGGIDFHASYWVEIPGASYWSGDFSTPRGTPVLRPGTYENARRWPFHDAPPGMDISGDRRGCNDLRGRYTIHELARAPDGFLSAFHIASSSTASSRSPRSAASSASEQAEPAVSYVGTARRPPFAPSTRSYPP